MAKVSFLLVVQILIVSIKHFLGVKHVFRHLTERLFKRITSNTPVRLMLKKKCKSVVNLTPGAFKICIYIFGSD